MLHARLAIVDTLELPKQATPMPINGFWTGFTSVRALARALLSAYA